MGIKYKLLFSLPVSFSALPSWTSSVLASHLLAHLWCQLLLGSQFCAAVTTGCLVSAASCVLFQPWLSLDVTWYTCACSLEIVWECQHFMKQSSKRKQEFMGQCFPFSSLSLAHSSLGGPHQSREWITWPFLSLTPPASLSPALDSCPLGPLYRIAFLYKDPCHRLCFPWGTQGKMLR